MHVHWQQYFKQHLEAGFTLNTKRSVNIQICERAIYGNPWRLISIFHQSSSAATADATAADATAAAVDAAADDITTCQQ